MPQIGPESLKAVQEALERYVRIVEASRLRRLTKDTYILHARNFVRWLDDGFEPGSRLPRNGDRTQEAAIAEERPVFRLNLERTYYNKGFFNVPVRYDDFVRADDGTVVIVLGEGREVQGRVSRSANMNKTARVYGGAALRNWFQQNYAQGASVPVIFESPQRLRLGN